MTFQQILQNIKDLKIQGAQKIAVAAVEAFKIKLEEKASQEELEKSVVDLANARATEPALRNSLRYCLKNYQTEKNIAEKVIEYFKNSQKKIIEYGAKKIENNMIVQTHCHSSTVTGIIIEAKKQGKNFKVNNTETRPKFQGRITAEELANEGIEVHHFVDSAGRVAMKQADLFLFGCDAITSEGRIINKIGTNMLLEFANKYNVLTYSCTNSWKFNPETVFGAEEEIEQRNTNEVWENPLKNIIIHNPAFEPVSPDLMTGIITELGVFKSESLIEEIRRAYPWLI